MQAEGDALLTAIAKARAWIDDIRLGRLASFSEIAERESQGERHIRLLAPLAFVSPRIIAAIARGTAPAYLTVTGLAKALPYSWAEFQLPDEAPVGGDGFRKQSRGSSHAEVRSEPRRTDGAN
jgi:hypothetical protein